MQAGAVSSGTNGLLIPDSVHGDTRTETQFYYADSTPTRGAFCHV